MNSAKQLKIAFVSDAVLPFHKGGKETRIYHLSQALTRMGQEVHVYTMKWWDNEGGTYTHDNVTYHALCRLYPLYIGDRRSFKEGIMFGIACFKMIFHNFDVLETDHMPYFPLFSTKLVCILKRKPLYATWHEVVGWRAWKEYLGLGGGTVAYIIEQLSVKLPNHIVAVSDHTKEQLKSVLHYKRQLSLVSNGIDYVRIKPILPATNHMSDVIYTGRLVAHKNVDLLIEAIAKLRTELPNIRCVIIGSGPEYQNLQKIIKKNKLGKNIFMTGRLESSDDVYGLMKVSKIFVSPSIREGFGITILEAYACGLSVVTVKHRDNVAQYLVQKGTGIVCDPTATDIAKSIKTLLKQSPDEKQITDVSHFDWGQQAIALKEVYGL